jgi:hypothetical protein
VILILSLFFTNAYEINNLKNGQVENQSLLFYFELPFFHSIVALTALAAFEEPSMNDYEDLPSSYEYYQRDSSLHPLNHLQ